jgi:hypothetical protein
MGRTRSWILRTSKGHLKEAYIKPDIHEEQCITNEVSLKKLMIDHILDRSKQPVNLTMLMEAEVAARPCQRATTGSTVSAQ